MVMNSQQRVLTALRGQQPDRVPFCELVIDRSLARQLMGWDEVDKPTSMETTPYTVEEAKAVASFLKIDNISYILRAPIYCQKGIGKDGRVFYGEGLIKTEADLAMLDLPNPYNDALYVEAEEFIRQKGDFSAWFITRVGISPTILGMGTTNFSFALYDNLSLIEEIFDRYCEWACVVAERACQLGFEVFATTDDVAFKTNTFFSPEVFRELVMPRFERVAEIVTIPWVIHSDGNMHPFMDDLLTLDISGFHPNEKGAMDIRAMKRDYGDRLCLLGNVDLVTLGMGTPEEVEAEVRALIRDIGPGGGYILSSGNSLAGYLRPENVLAMSAAVQKYGRYPLDL